jgi:hypothetical protein
VIGKVMLTVTLDPADASLDHVRRALDLNANEVDHDFGVVEVDPDNHRYAVLVDEAAAARVQDAVGVEGPFSNPRIEPFGPPDARASPARD